MGPVVGSFLRKFPFHTSPWTCELQHAGFWVPVKTPKIENYPKVNNTPSVMHAWQPLATHDSWFTQQEPAATSFISIPQKSGERQETSCLLFDERERSR